MADTHLILTAIGDDRPGLVEALATAISSHGGNWLESSMAQLSGKFAGIVNVAVPAAEIDSLKAALGALSGLKVTAEVAGNAPGPMPRRRLALDLVGHDRVGIVREVAQILARHAVNVESLETRSASAPMSAELMFHCKAALTAAQDFNARALKADFEKLSEELMADIALGETL
jgi:glycine cleavage system regulatory protein